jgi:hypothetical protein
LANESDQRDQAVRCILRYLLEHPAAADKAEGVRDWWLHDMGDVSRAAVADALEELLKRGWLVVRVNIHGASTYAFNEKEARAVARFLAQPGDRHDG